MRHVIGLVCLCLMVLAGTPAMAQEARTIIIMDGSGSMWGQIDGRPKLEIARDTVATVLSAVPDSVSLGLMAYGHRQRGDCDDIELIVEPAAGTAPAILDAVNSMRFQGKTPLTRSVELAAEALRSTEEPATIVLVTDGIETCDADPCALASALESSGIDLTAHVIGFGLSADEGVHVACIAENTGGRFLPANDADSLADALTTAVTGGDGDADVGPAPVDDVSVGSRHFPGAEMMPDVAVVPTGRSFGETLPYPAEFSFPADGTIAQCQAICTADKLCGSWRYEPAGSYYIEHARCFTHNAATELAADHYRQGEGWASGMKDGVIGLRRRYVPAGATDIDVALSVPAPVFPGSEFTVLWKGPAGEKDWVDIVPADHTDLTGELSYFYVNETIEEGDLPEGAGTLTAPVDPGTYKLRYILGRDVDRRAILSLPIIIGGDGPATAEIAGTSPPPDGDARLVSATFSAETGGIELSVTWSATPVEGQDLPPEAWAMQEGSVGPVTEFFLPGEYDVVGDAGDSVFAGRVRITPESPNEFVIPYSAALSPAGEDSAEAGYVCDGADACRVEDPTGLSFVLPAGWQSDQPFFYETAGGSAAELPSATFTGPQGEPMLLLNPVRWSESNGTCTTSAAGDLCIWGTPDGAALAGLATILPSLAFARQG